MKKIFKISLKEKILLLIVVGYLIVLVIDKIIDNIQKRDQEIRGYDKQEVIIRTQDGF